MTCEEGDGSASSINQASREMPSRKKAKGKARKAAKAKKEAEEEEAEERKHEIETPSLELQARMAQLSIRNNEGGSSCTHRSVSLDRRTEEFIKEYLTVKNQLIRMGRTPGKSLNEANDITQEKYQDIWHDVTKMELVQSSLVAISTQYILEDSIEQARGYASLACHFEQHLAVVLKEDLSSMNIIKMFELGVADKHTLVKYLMKHVPCSCLEDVYKEVKSIPKVGLCCNRECGQNRIVERSTMLNCTRCRQANYCSRECQVADWPGHKEVCFPFHKCKSQEKNRESVL